MKFIGYRAKASDRVGTPFKLKLIHDNNSNVLLRFTIVMVPFCSECKTNGHGRIIHPSTEKLLLLFPEAFSEAGQ
jgi:hypothetical protein